MRATTPLVVQSTDEAKRALSSTRRDRTSCHFRNFNELIIYLLISLLRTRSCCGLPGIVMDPILGVSEQLDACQHVTAGVSKRSSDDSTQPSLSLAMLAQSITGIPTAPHAQSAQEGSSTTHQTGAEKSLRHLRGQISRSMEMQAR